MLITHTPEFSACAEARADQQKRSQAKNMAASHPPPFGSKAVNGEEEGAQPATTSVSVDDSETWVESKRYTVYKVVVRMTDKAYFVFRR